MEHKLKQLQLEVESQEGKLQSALEQIKKQEQIKITQEAFEHKLKQMQLKVENLEGKFQSSSEQNHNKITQDVCDKEILREDKNKTENL